MVFRDRSRQSSQYTDIQHETRSVAALIEVEAIAVMSMLPEHAPLT
jgi:hypothetical protein